ncbi:nucleotide sugar dehydrogenase [Lichenihabitans psoromatis]|uniref:nucleotide sugar dehydrogenase n=1 Tax=Lichenihabitans psoromatis TaxID=2528642 RepID=UPI00103832BC|nr:nucleotide sugar dehydrogenase [Lichenihabitans psoromatis]
MLPSNFADSQITIIGLGYVGLTLAVAMADAGFRVHGIEHNQLVLDQLKQGKAHFTEIGLNEKLTAQVLRGRFTFSASLSESKSTVFIVTVGTPIGFDKQTQSEPLKQVIEAIASILKNGDLVVLRSTVRIGATENIVKPILNNSGKLYDLAFCPERTLEGRALLELRSLPQIVGGVNQQSTFRASQVFSFLTPSIVRVSNAATAEAIKLVNNTQRDYIFAFANEVAAIADVLGLSAHEIISGGNLGYPRANLPFPGPVGGPCLEKDPYILAEGLAQVDFVPELALAARRFNENLLPTVVCKLVSKLKALRIPSPDRIAVLGFAFKGRPETNDLRGSMVTSLITELKAQFPSSNLVGWDPIVSKFEIDKLGAKPTSSPEEAFDGSRLVIIQNNHEFFQRADLARLSQAMQSPGVIYDFWNSQNGLDEQNLPEGIKYLALGELNVNV